MCVQQFFVSNMIREAIGGLCPQYLIVDSNTLFECESLRRTIGDSRISPLGQRLSVRADMTLMVNTTSIDCLNDRLPLYLVTVEIQRDPMLSDNKHIPPNQHKDYRKIILMMRNMLNDTIRSIGNEVNLTVFGLLVAPDGIVLLEMCPELNSSRDLVVKRNNLDCEEYILYFRLHESKVIDIDNTMMLINYLRTTVAQQLMILSRTERGNHYIMDSAIAMNAKPKRKGHYPYISQTTPECSFEQFNDKVLDVIFALVRVDHENMSRKISEALGSYRESEEEVMNRNFTTVEGRSYIIVEQDLSLRLMTQQKDIDEVYIIWKENRNSRTQLFSKNVKLNDRLVVAKLARKRLFGDNDE